MACILPQIPDIAEGAPINSFCKIILFQNLLERIIDALMLGGII